MSGGLPPAVTENVTGSPSQTVWLAGGDVMSGSPPGDQRATNADAEPPAVVKLPPAKIWLEAPEPVLAIASTSAFVPAASAAHDAPSYFATRFAAEPPAVVKSPPA